MNTRRLTWLFAGLALTASCASQQRTADEQACIDAVQTFFDVIATSDVDAGAALTVPDGVFVNVREQDGARSLGSFSNADWLAGMGTREGELFEAFDGVPTVLVDGDVAVVWTRYLFDVDGARSHTGTDAFTLVRTDEGWKIAGGVYSLEFTAD